MRLPTFNFSRSVAFAVMASVACPSTASAQTTALSGDEIYVRALATWSAQPTPAVLSYRVDAKLTDKGHVREERERIVLRTADRTAIVAKLAVEGDGTERIARVVFERPRFDPDATFRLVARSRDDIDESAAPGALRTITHVVARVKRYAVELVGEGTYRDRPVYELKLTPLFDPRINSVRAMFVDTQSFVTWRVSSETPYAVGPAHGTFMLDAQFAPVGNAWLISRITTAGAFHLGPFAYGGDGDVEYRIIDTKADVPAYCFERAGYARHADCAARAGFVA